MVKMCNVRPLVLLIVVLVAVIGGNDVSCASSTANTNDVAAVEAQEEIETSPLRKVPQAISQTADDLKTRITTILGRLSKTQYITISLVAAAVILTSSLAIHGAKNSPRKYDIVDEAERVNAALESSSGSTQDELNRITTALCKTFSDSSTDHPFKFTTGAGITQSPITQNGTFHNTTVGTNSTAGTSMNNTEAMTTMQLPTEDPEPICAPAADKIFKTLKNFIGKLTGGFIEFDMIEEDDKTQIEAQLNETAGINCKSGFFRDGDINGHEGLSFDTTNEFVNNAMNNDACEMAANEILPALYEMGLDSNSTSATNGTTVTFETDEMKADFLQGEEIAKNKDCGSGFFQISGDEDKSIQYENSNTYISKGFSKAINDKGCQERADRVMAMLTYGGHSSTDTAVQMTARSSTYDIAALKAAYALGDNCTCEEGGLMMEENNGGLVFSYHNTNAFIIKALERAPEEITCLNTGKNVLASLLDMGLYSKDAEASIIVPERNLNIPNLIREIDAAVGYNCKDDFFKYEESEGYFKVQYKKNNPYIQPELEKISDSQICESTAKGVINILKAYEKPITSGNNAVALTAKQSVKDELSRKLSNTVDINCGEGFFTTEDGHSYVGISFRSTNEYINPLL